MNATISNAKIQTLDASKDNRPSSGLADCQYQFRQDKVNVEIKDAQIQSVSANKDHRSDRKIPKSQILTVQRSMTPRFQVQRYKVLKPIR